MELVGNQEITKSMIASRKKELTAEVKEVKADIRTLTKKQTALKKKKGDEAAEALSIVQNKISLKKQSLSNCEDELEFYSSKYEPVRLMGAVINLKLFKEIQKKIKGFRLDIKKSEWDSIVISWNEAGSEGSFVLNDLSDYFKNIIYIPELILDVEADVE